MQNNLLKNIEKNALNYPKKIAINFENTSLSYLQLLDNIKTLAFFLEKEKKCKKGDRIVILSNNRIEYITLFYACIKLGTILVPINWRLTSHETVNIIKNVNAKILFIESDFKKDLKYIKNKIPNLETVKIDLTPKILKENIKRQSTNNFNKNFNTPALIVHTSGTTGKPKGAVLSQKAIYYNILNSIKMHQFKKSDHILTVIPLFHVGGLNIQTIPALHVGATVTIHKKFDLQETFTSLEYLKPTFTVFVPTIMETIIKSKSWSSSKLSSLKAITTGSTIVSPDLVKLYENNKIPIIQVYGSTETAPIAVCQNLKESRKPYGNSGKPAKHTKVEIFDESGKIITNNAIGEIGIKGQNLFSGYWNDKVGTNKAFNKDWFMTGDYAKKNKEGQFFIVGRKENIIISGGENIYSAELEQTLLKEKYIIEAAVIGIPDKKWQEIPIAYIKIKTTINFNESKILKNLKNKLAKYKIPKKLITIDEIPKNALGKIDYKVLKEYYNGSKN